MKPNIKKRLLAYVGVLLSLLVILTVAQPKQPDTPTQPSTQGPHDTRPPEGSVRIHTCDAALGEVFTALAREYTDLTGTDVQVYVARQSCAASLEAMENSGTLPTLFCLHSQADFDRWKGSLYDLTGSGVTELLSSGDFALGADGQLLAIATDVQAYGLICNARLLAHSGFTREDIHSFAELQTISRHITALAQSYAAFSSADLSDDVLTGLLTQLLPRETDLRSFWDLYIANSTGTTPAALEDFLSEKSVFYVGSTAEYDRIESLLQPDLDILPVFTEAGGSLQYRVSLAWGIHKGAAAADISRTLEFLQWLGTPGEDGTVPVERLGLLTPFRAATGYANQLEKKLRGYMLTEQASLFWQDSHLLPAETLTLLGQALSDYRADPGEESWQAVKALLS